MRTALNWLNTMLRPSRETIALMRRRYETKLREAGLSRRAAKTAAAIRFPGKHD